MQSRTTGNLMSLCLAGGALGGVVITMFVYVFAALIGERLGLTVRFLGSLVATNPGTQAWIGGIVLGVMALVWGALYAYARNGLSLEGWSGGLVYGLLVWLVSTSLIFPLIAFARPAATAALVPAPGLLALGFGAKAILTSLLAHAVYGMVLGAYVAAQTDEEVSA